MAWRLASSAALVTLVVLLRTYEATAGCKNCIEVANEQAAHLKALDKEGRSLLRAHWAACGGDGERRQAYCALRRCKLLAKDGKLRKAALAHAPTRLAQVLERCSNQTGESPEDVAWNIFRCAFDPKSLMLDLPPPDTEAGVA
ncbi:unnamed protein product, partial [Iphiclides podalirius]